MIKQLKENIWQLHFRNFGSCVYLIKIPEKDKKIIIDTSSYEARDELLSDFEQLNIKPSKIDFVIITHSHWDHVGNLEIFKNAKTLDSGNLEEGRIKEIPELSEIETIKTPGHSKDSLCILYREVLFSGDTIFHNGFIGRVDLPGSSVKDMQESLEKVKTINYEILAPGHLM